MSDRNPDEATSSKLSFDRRSVLKSVGGTVGAGVLASQMSRAARDGTTEFNGLAYDPYTHQAQGVASAEIETDDADNLSGVLRVPGMKIPLGQDESLEPIHDGRYTEYETTKDDPQFTEDGEPLKITVKDFGFELFVDLTRPAYEYGSLNVTLPAKERGKSADDVRGLLIGNGNGNPDRPKKNIPDSGIPPENRPAVPAEGGDD